MPESHTYCDANMCRLSARLRRNSRHGGCNCAQTVMVVVVIVVVVVVLASRIPMKHALYRDLAARAEVR